MNETIKQQLLEDLGVDISGIENTTEVVAIPGTIDDIGLQNITDKQKWINTLCKGIHTVFNPWSNKGDYRVLVLHKLRNDLLQINNLPTDNVRDIIPIDEDSPIDGFIYNCIYGKNIPSIVYLLRLYGELLKLSYYKPNNKLQYKYSGLHFTFFRDIIEAKIIKCKKFNNYQGLEDAFITLLDLLHRHMDSNDKILEFIDHAVDYVMDKTTKLNIPNIDDYLNKCNNEILEISNDQNVVNEVLNNQVLGYTANLAINLARVLKETNNGKVEIIPKQTRHISDLLADYYAVLNKQTDYERNQEITKLIVMTIASLKSL